MIKLIDWLIEPICSNLLTIELPKPFVIFDGNQAEFNFDSKLDGFFVDKFEDEDIKVILVADWILIGEDVVWNFLIEMKNEMFLWINHW